MLEEKDGDMTQVEVDTMPGSMGDEGTKTFTNDAVPSRVVFFVKLLLDVGGDVILVFVLLEGLDRAVNSILLHLLGHEVVHNHDQPVGHLELLVFKSLGMKLLSTCPIASLLSAIRHSLVQRAFSEALR